MTIRRIESGRRMSQVVLYCAYLAGQIVPAAVAGEHTLGG